MTEAIAFLNYGRWLIECPGCSEPATLRPGQTEYHHYFPDEETGETVGCGTRCTIVWPPNLGEINAAFDVRTKTWPVWDDDDEPTGETYEDYGGAYDGRDHLRSWNPGQSLP